MKLDFIEIGTADFRTLAEVPDLIGISIEPVKEYFDRLTDRKGLIKINAAVSDKPGTAKMYYYPRSYIEEFSLPLWFAGCHSMNNPHQPCLDWLKDNGHHYPLHQTQGIEVITLEQIFKDNNVTEIDFLKIDTEGHDYTIMKSLFNLEEKPEIKKIQFESNLLMKDSEKKELYKLARDHGYLVETEVTRGNEDTILTK